MPYILERYLNEFLYLTVDFFSIAILLVVAFNCKRKMHVDKNVDGVFVAIIYSTALYVFFDALLWAINGKTFSGAFELNIVLTTLFYVVTPLPCLFWLLYVLLVVGEDLKRIRSLLLYGLLPLWLTYTVLSLFSSVFDVFFVISPENNEYSRGKWYFVSLVILYAYYAIYMAVCAKNRNHIIKSNNRMIFIFPVVSLLGSILQSLFYGLPLVGGSLTVAILLIFLDNQNKFLYYDYLTGLYNRRQLDNLVRLRIKRGAKNHHKYFCGIMLDVLSFKDINDLYGHQQGDEALVCASKILKSCINPKSDFLFRLGGDEFVVLVYANEKDEIYRVIENIEINSEDFNRKHIKPYKIIFSLGYEIYDSEHEFTANAFFEDIDEKMYEHKRMQKRAEKRK